MLRKIAGYGCGIVVTDWVCTGFIPQAASGPERADMRAFRPLVRPLRDRSANADRSHMTVFSGPTGPKISLTGNQVIMPYPAGFRIVGAGSPGPGGLYK